MPELNKTDATPSTLDSKFKDFILGLFAPFAALELIAKNKLILVLSIIPFLLSISIIILITSLSPALVPAQWSGLQWGVFNLGSIAQVLVGFLFVFIGFQILAVLLNLVASPLNDFISEKTEIAISGSCPSPRGFKEFFTFFLNDVRRSFIILILMLICTLGAWIPGIGLFFLVGVAFLNAATFVAYPMNRRGGNTRATFAWLKSNWPRSLGFGIAASLLFGIPVINLFALPLCVVGGTICYLKK